MCPNVLNPKKDVAAETSPATAIQLQHIVAGFRDLSKCTPTIGPEHINVPEEP